jgi:hypothetical protein
MATNIGSLRMLEAQMQGFSTSRSKLQGVNASHQGLRYFDKLQKVSYFHIPGGMVAVAKVELQGAMVRIIPTPGVGYALVDRAHVPAGYAKLESLLKD